MQRIAIIDVGSNSARLVISRIYKNGAYNLVYNQKESLRLAQKVDENQRLTPEAFAATVAAMANFAHMCRLYKADKIIAVATAAIRNAVNGRELAAAVEKSCGIKLEIIPGETEAYNSYLGVINTLPADSGIIFDLGGGSTELIYFKHRRLQEAVSLPYGAVNTTELFGTKEQMSPEAYQKLAAFLKEKLAEHPWLQQKGLPLIGVGGTARTVAKIIQRAQRYPNIKLHNYQIRLPLFQNYFAKMRATTPKQRLQISGLSKERSDIILAGSSIVACLLEVTGCKTLTISGCGLREGLFYQDYAAAWDLPLIAPDILERSRENILKFYVADIPHARRVAALALNLFDGWKKLHGLRSGSRKLLETAALLHDVGITVNYYSHARHSAYLIQNAPLFGLSHKEQLMTAAVAGWHNGIAKNYFRSKFYQEMLSKSNWSVINKLAVLLGLAEALDYTQTGQVRALKAAWDQTGASLDLQVTDNAAIELKETAGLAGWFKKIFGTDLRLSSRTE